MNEYDVEYSFFVPGERTETFLLTIDPETMLANTMLEDQSLPEWSRLEFHQCSHCPLSSDEHSHCPLARRLRGLVDRFKAVVSHDRLMVQVRTAERLVRQNVSAQQAIGSFMGLLMATCDCPHMAFFRPMARFHLALANNEETIYRAASMFLLAQYFRHRRGEDVDLDMDGLIEIYHNVHIVNEHVAKRLRAGCTADALVNGLVLLDSFAHLLPLSTRQDLHHIEHLFRNYEHAFKPVQPTQPA